MSSKYIDTNAIIQVIGNVYNNPSLLDADDKYMITEDDFVEPFHKVIFGSIYKLYEQGAKKITLENITDYLSTRPKSEGIYRQGKGNEWIARVSDGCTPSAFDYYYNRLKKFSLLRAYDNCGMDVSGIYDPDNILDIKKKQAQEEYIDNSTLEDIAKQIDDKIEAIKSQYVEGVFGEPVQAAEGIFDLIDSFKDNPEVGVPLYGDMINNITRGARLRKFYLRSAPTGIGNFRTFLIKYLK